MVKTSIIIAHWAQNNFRSETMRRCINSVIETTKHLPVEIIVVDNGENLADSQYLLELAHLKKIQFYVRNSENLYFGFARNTGVDLSCGDYLVFSDNDIEYKEGWLEKCIKILETFPDRKLAATPLRTDRQHRHFRYWREQLDFDGGKIYLNIRAGSNSWVMKRKDFEAVGRFRNHHIAGTKWTDNFVNSGYLMATLEREPLATDVGFRKGYDYKMKATIARKLCDGTEVGINS